MYLLDANVLIDANRDFYGLEAVPEFWGWLLYQAEAGQIKIPNEIYDELTPGKHPLDIWLRENARRNVLELAEEIDVVSIQKVLSEGYAPDLTDAEIGNLGRDPFLIAYALIDTPNRIVVTTEVSKPKRLRANKHVPDVCDLMGVKWCPAFDLYRQLGFRTNWRAQT